MNDVSEYSPILDSLDMVEGNKVEGGLLSCDCHPVYLAVCDAPTE